MKAIDTTSKKVLYWYFRGLPQEAVAVKCGVSQAKVSRCRAKFTKLALAFGIPKAAKEYGIMHEVETLRELATQLYKADISVAEAKSGAEMVTLFDDLDVLPADYKKLTKALTEVPEPGFAAAAIKLVSLEETTGKGYEESVAGYEEVAKKLEEGNQTLAGLYKEKEQAEKAVNDLEEIRKEKEQDLATFLKNAEKQKQDTQEALDSLLAGAALVKNQLATIHPVVTAAHKLGLPDKDLTSFLEERLHLKELGVAPKDFNDVAGVLAVAGDLDTTAFKEKLGEYGNLDKSVAALNAEKVSVKSEVELLTATKPGLEQEVKALNTSIKHQKKENQKLVKKATTLEANIASLNSKKETLAQQVVEKEIRQLQLLKKTTELQEGIIALDDGLKARAAELTNLETRVKAAGHDYVIFEALIDTVKQADKPWPSPTTEDLAAIFKAGREVASNLESFLVSVASKFSGGPVDIIGCESCGARLLMVNRGNAEKQLAPVPSQCPDCGEDTLVVQGTVISCGWAQGKVVIIKQVPKLDSGKDTVE